MVDKQRYHLTVDCDDVYELGQIADLAQFIQDRNQGENLRSYGNLPGSLWLLLQEVEIAVRCDAFWKGQDCMGDTDRSEWDSVRFGASRLSQAIKGRFKEAAEGGEGA